MHLSKQHKKILLALLGLRQYTPVGVRLEELVFYVTEGYKAFLKRGTASLPVRARRAGNKVLSSFSRSMKTLEIEGLVKKDDLRWSLTEKGLSKAREIHKQIEQEFTSFKDLL